MRAIWSGLSNFDELFSSYQKSWHLMSSELLGVESLPNLPKPLEFVSGNTLTVLLEGWRWNPRSQFGGRDSNVSGWRGHNYVDPETISTGHQAATWWTWSQFSRTTISHATRTETPASCGDQEGPSWRGSGYDGTGSTISIEIIARETHRYGLPRLVSDLCVSD